MKYRAGARADYDIRPIDDLTLIHHRRPGTTHVVSPVCAAILEVLCGDELTAENIVECLSATYDLQADVGETIAQTIAVRLDEMADMDIIDRIS